MEYNKKMISLSLTELFNDNLFAVAGVMANIQAESAYKPNNLQNSYEKIFNLTDQQYTAGVDIGKIDKETFMHDHAGYGLCQWTHWSRKQTLYEFAKKTNESIGNLQMQISYLCEDIKLRYSKMYEKLLISKSVEDSTRIFMLEYEKPANQSEENIQKRIDIAKQVYSELTSVDSMKHDILSAIAVIESQIDYIKEVLSE